jgi:uncharacterized protein YpmS
MEAVSNDRVFRKASYLWEHNKCVFILILLAFCFVVLMIILVVYCIFIEPQYKIRDKQTTLRDVYFPHVVLRYFLDVYTI